MEEAVYKKLVGMHSGRYLRFYGEALLQLASLAALGESALRALSYAPRRTSLPPCCVVE